MDDQAHRIADALRDELRRRALKEFGSYPALSTALGVPYKSVYRYLTENGKDKLMPPLPFVIQTVEVLHERGGDDFATFYAAATRDVL